MASILEHEWAASSAEVSGGDLPCSETIFLGQDLDGNGNNHHNHSHNERNDNQCSNTNKLFDGTLGCVKSTDQQQNIVTPNVLPNGELPVQMASTLCPYLKNGETFQCRYGILCIYDHGDLCEICGHYCLDPTDEESRNRHRAEHQIKSTDTENEELPMGQKASIKCPHLRNGDTFQCRYGNLCIYDHGDLCDVCGRYCLHPTDEESRKRHRAEHQVYLEPTDVAGPTDKICSICLTAIKKSRRQRHIGILPNCNHTFCLHCIRKWRHFKQFKNKVTRMCPECRVPSHFVFPSYFFVKNKKEKNALIDGYKRDLQTKECTYFAKGGGSCPFGNKCFYKHALPSGEAIDVGPPHKNDSRGYGNDIATGGIEELGFEVSWFQSSDANFGTH